jgi:hypothetical protein
MRKAIVTGICLLPLAALLFYIHAIARTSFRDTLGTIPNIVLANSTPNRAGSYREILEQIGRQKTNLLPADTSADAAALAESAKKIMSYWYGTPWSSDGDCREPNSGHISGRYFVCSVLRDLGYRFDVERMARQDPARIVEAFCRKTDIASFTERSFGELEEYVKKAGKGVFLLGLDNHIGFIVYDWGISFVHSNSYFPQKVMSEKARYSLKLRVSKIWVVGKLFSGDFVKAYLEDRVLDIPD